MTHVKAVYYHVRAPGHQPGEIILPGRFGRLIHEQGTSHPLWAREQVLEDVRARSYPTKPSRLDCCYVFDNAMTAGCFQTTRPREVVYLVQIIDETLPMHVGDLYAVEPRPTFNRTMEEIAHAYWTRAITTNISEWPKGIRCDEVLTASAIQVV